jgi:hypothetical protein
MAKQPKRQLEKQPAEQPHKPRTWIIESGTRGTYVGGDYAHRAANRPLFSWSPIPHGSSGSLTGRRLSSPASRALRPTPGWGGRLIVPGNVILLGQVAGRLDMLAAACSRCPRHGRLKLARLVAPDTDPTPPCRWCSAPRPGAARTSTIGTDAWRHVWRKYHP